MRQPVGLAERALRTLEDKDWSTLAIDSSKLKARPRLMAIVSSFSYKPHASQGPRSSTLQARLMPMPIVSGLGWTYLTSSFLLKPYAFQGLAPSTHTEAWPKLVIMSVGFPQVWIQVFYLRYQCQALKRGNQTWSACDACFSCVSWVTWLPLPLHERERSASVEWHSMIKVIKMLSWWMK